MQIRVVTLPWDAQNQSFSESRLLEATSGKDVLSAQERWATIDGRDVLVLTLQLVNGAIAGAPRQYSESSEKRKAAAIEFLRKLEVQMPEDTKVAFSALRDWRTKKAQEKGSPTFVIATNRQLAEIVFRAPKSLAALKEVNGIGKNFVKNYGEEVLAFVKDLEAVEFTMPDEDEKGEEIKNDKNEKSAKAQASANGEEEQKA